MTFWKNEAEPDQDKESEKELSMEEEFWRLEKNAKNGDVDAKVGLAEHYYNGQVVKRDVHNAFHWYLAAAREDHLEAQCRVGEMYESGTGLPEREKNPEQAALRWYLKSAEGGNAKAFFRMGEMYHAGRGVLKNEEKGMDLYTEAAERGSTDAQFRLGEIHENGEGVLQNYRYAQKWYAKAAEQGHTDAQGKLGAMYDLGKGFDGADKALKWYTKAAKKGNAEALYRLGMIYNDGRGVKQDYYQAYIWLIVAVAVGHEKAGQARNKSEGHLNYDQILDAQDMARNWVEDNTQLQHLVGTRDGGSQPQTDG